MEFFHSFEATMDLIQFFQNGRYEEHILAMMNKSQIVFPNRYRKIKSQSHGECDFITVRKRRKKFDAKLLLSSEQIMELTDGKRHCPQIEGFLHKMLEEASVNLITENIELIQNTKLYQRMKQRIERDKEDENLIFFHPFPLVPAKHGGIYEQFALDGLNMIFDVLKEEVDLKKREIYIIYPSDWADNRYILRNLSKDIMEEIEYKEIGEYFTYSIKMLSCL